MVNFRFALITIIGLSTLNAISCKKNSGGGADNGGVKPKPGEPIAKNDASEPPIDSTAEAPDDSSETPPKIPAEAALFTLTDQSSSLEGILEQGTLSKADCDSYFKGQTDRKTTLRCGKWMFFYDSLGVPGSPAKLTDLIRDKAPTTVGKSFEKFGLYPDPYSKTKLPVGMAPGPDMVAGVPTYTLTCGTCHFGKIPDGRYVVGQPNPDFAFGKMILTITTMPELALQPGKKLDVEAKKILDPISEEIFGKLGARAGVISQVIALIPNVIVKKNKPLNNAEKLDLAVSPPGIMDPYSAPSLDDGVRVPARMVPLWGIDQKGMEAAGSKHGAMLGSAGGAPDLQHILRTFGVISSVLKDEPVPKDLEAHVVPLIQYILSLSPPRKAGVFDKVKLAAGEQLFKKSCVSCHNGPGYAGTQIFSPIEIGTDPNVMKLVHDPKKEGKAIFDVVLPEEITSGVRARKLSGVWSMSHLLHNGSVSSLADLFCLNGPRPDSGLGSGYSSAGHRYTCDGLTPVEKNNIIAFLESL